MYDLNFFKGKSLKVGLLGGTFDPAHEGHIYISNLAINLFALDYVWWLVSPQNPLKKSQTHDSFVKRYNNAKIYCDNDKIIVSDIEKDLGSIYTYDTVLQLKTIFKYIDFLWIMGADILGELHKWHNWQGLCDNIHLASFARDQYNLENLDKKVYDYLNKFNINNINAKAIFQYKLPCMIFVPSKKISISSSQIRKGK